MHVSEPGVPALPPLLPLILALFVGSGGAALIYEIVWFQLLQLVIGSSAVSLGVLLGTFMGGMCLGSLLLPRWLSDCQASAAGLCRVGTGDRADWHCGAAWHAAGRAVLHRARRQRFDFGTHARLVCAICLLPPTVLMGDPAGDCPLGRQFARGGFLARFLLRLRVTLPGGGGGMLAGRICTCCACMTWRLPPTWPAINFVVAACAFALSTFSPFSPRADRVSKPIAATPQQPIDRHPPARSVILAIAISGMTALAAEVVWTRHSFH